MEEVEDTQHFLEFYNIDLDEEVFFNEFYEFHEFLNKNIYAETIRGIIQMNFTSLQVQKVKHDFLLNFSATSGLQFITDTVRINFYSFKLPYEIKSV